MLSIAQIRYINLRKDKDDLEGIDPDRLLWERTRHCRL